jgi:rhodanese-related sulfurtransferase
MNRIESRAFQIYTTERMEAAVTIFSKSVGEEGYETISPAELSERMRRNDDLLLIDVREPEEHALARIEGARLLPLSLFPEWAETLDANKEIVFMCHHGIRSAQVCAFLARQGYNKLYNLAGGIDAWSHEVDASVPTY